MNPRDIGIEWRHETLPLTLWIHPGTNFGRADIVLSAMRDIRGKIPQTWFNLFYFANAYVLDFEWQGEESHPLVDYLARRNILDVSSTLEDFLLLGLGDALICSEAYLAIHPVADDETPEDDNGKKKLSDADGSEKPESKTKPEQEQEPEPTT